MRMSENVEIKVGNRFVRAFPSRRWWSIFAKVDIEYCEYEITKVFEKSFRVARINEKGEVEKYDSSWKIRDDLYLPSKEDAEKNILNNSEELIKDFDRVIAKYTPLAFNYWYGKAQQNVLKYFYNSVKENGLGYKAVEKIKPLIDKENKILSKKFKELK